MEFLRGNIVRILDDQRLIINIGSEHGAKIGDRFYIYESGEEITDPNSGESLGELELVKAEVETMHVQEKMAFVMPIQKKNMTSSTVLSATLAQISPSGRYGADADRDRLAVRTEQISGLSQAKPIAIGDAVRSVNPIEKT